jgi:hypothetical protein
MVLAPRFRALPPEEADLTAALFAPDGEVERAPFGCPDLAADPAAASNGRGAPLAVVAAISAQASRPATAAAPTAARCPGSHTGSENGGLFTRAPSCWFTAVTHLGLADDAGLR